jgi:hypothetical protein
VSRSSSSPRAPAPRRSHTSITRHGITAEQRIRADASGKDCAKCRPTQEGVVRCVHLCDEFHPEVISWPDCAVGEGDADVALRKSARGGDMMHDDGRP